MPGFWGRENFIIGEPGAPKPVRSGPCENCGVECLREIFTPGRGWRWRHGGCDPHRPTIERRFKRGHIPIAYVPKEYENVEKTTRFDPSLAQAIRKQS